MYSFVEDNSTKLFIGALVLSLILVGIYSCYCLKKLNMNKGNRSDCAGKLLVRPQHSLLPYNEKWEISKESIEFESLLGKGAFGSVHKALVKDIRIGEEYSTAAVKVARNVYDEGQIFALKSELKIMLHVGQHENIVTLLGACTKNALQNGEIYLVFEYCEKGSIKDFLCKNRDSFSYQHHGLEFGTQSTDSLRQNESVNYVSMDSRQHLLDRNYSALSTPDSLLSNITTFTYVNSQNVLASTDCSDQEVYQLSYQDLLVWALQISSGMEYLAYKEVIHGDLAARNILLTKDMKVKICDFGLAKDIYELKYYRSKPNKPLPIKWLAIEVLENGKFSKASDVWACGVTFWEIFSLGINPYPGEEANEEFTRNIVDGLRLPRPSHACEEMFKIMSLCWLKNPELRPRFTDIKENIEELIYKNNTAIQERNSLKTGKHLNENQYLPIQSDIWNVSSKEHEREHSGEVRAVICTSRFQVEAPSLNVKYTNVPLMQKLIDNKLYFKVTN